MASPSAAPFSLQPLAGAVHVLSGSSIRQPMRAHENLHRLIRAPHPQHGALANEGVLDLATADEGRLQHLPF